jgi:ketosteroid isomerase-like protein
MKMFRRIKFLIPILLLMMPSIACARPGETSNPPEGLVTYDSGHTDFGMAIAVGASGKIVVAADSYNEAGQSKPRGLVATAEEIRQFFANYIERCAQKDIGGLLALFSHRAVQNQRDGFDEIRRMYSDLFNQSQELRYHMEDTGIGIYQNAVIVRARCRVDQILKKGRAWKGQVRWILVRENGALKIRYHDDSVEGLLLHGSLAYFIGRPGYRLEKSAMRGESGGARSGEGGNGSEGDDSSGNGDDSGSGGSDDGSGDGDDGSGGSDDGSNGGDDDGGKGKGKDKGGGKGKGKGK